MTNLAARIMDCLSESRVPLAPNDIAHRLGKAVSDVMIAAHELEQAGHVVSKIQGLKGRRYYEVAA